MKRRLTYLAIAMGVVPVGLIARSMRGRADSDTVIGFITTYLGDMLWAVMFFFLFAATFIKAGTYKLGLLTLGFTLTIEISQLYRGEPLASLRGFPPTRFLLGTNFLWSDVACLLVGTTLATALHLVINRNRSTPAT